MKKLTRITLLLFLSLSSTALLAKEAPLYTAKYNNGTWVLAGMQGSTNNHMAFHATNALNPTGATKWITYVSSHDCGKFGCAIPHLAVAKEKNGNIGWVSLATPSLEAENFYVSESPLDPNGWHGASAAQSPFIGIWLTAGYERDGKTGIWILPYNQSLEKSLSSVDGGKSWQTIDLSGAQTNNKFVYGRDEKSQPVWLGATINILRQTKMHATQDIQSNTWGTYDTLGWKTGTIWDLSYFDNSTNPFWMVFGDAKTQGGQDTNEVAISKDAGKHWTSYSFPQNMPTSSVMYDAAHETYIAPGNGVSTLHVGKDLNDIKNWEDVEILPANKNQLPDYITEVTAGKDVNGNPVLVITGSQNTASSTTPVAAVSSDGGYTWKRIDFDAKAR